MSQEICVILPISLSRPHFELMSWEDLGIDIAPTKALVGKGPNWRRNPRSLRNLRNLRGRIGSVLEALIIEVHINLYSMYINLFYIL